MIEERINRNMPKMRRIVNDSLTGIIVGGALLGSLLMGVPRYNELRNVSRMNINNEYARDLVYLAPVRAAKERKRDMARCFHAEEMLGFNPEAYTYYKKRVESLNSGMDEKDYLRWPDLDQNGRVCNY